MSNDQEKKINQSDALKKGIVGDTTGSYDTIVIYLTKENGDVVVKGSMNYADIVEMEKLHAALPHEVVGMLFSALESEIKEKAYEQIESNQNTQN